MAFVDPNRHLYSDHHVDWMDSFYSNHKSKSSSLSVDLRHYPKTIIYFDMFVLIIHNSVMFYSWRCYNNIWWRHQLVSQVCGFRLLARERPAWFPTDELRSNFCTLVDNSYIIAWLFTQILIYAYFEKRFRPRNTYHLVGYPKITALCESHLLRLNFGMFQCSVL